MCVHQNAAVNLSGELRLDCIRCLGRLTRRYQDRRKQADDHEPPPVE